jgi:hypothetical protein
MYPNSAGAPSPSTSTAQSLASAQAAFRSVELRSPSPPPSSPSLAQIQSSPCQSISTNAAHPASETMNQPAEAQVQHTSREQLLSPSPVAASPPATAFDQPPLPASVLLPMQNHPSPASNSTPSNSHKRLRIQVPPPSLKGLVALVEAHVQSFGGEECLGGKVEGPRFLLLSQACVAEDAFYIALHQSFCIWDSPERGLLGKLPGFPATSILETAFEVLGTLIGNNNAVAPNHLKWFADFPRPLLDLMRTTEAWQKVVKDVGQFLGKLASNWGKMLRSCQIRGYPLLIDELVNQLGLTFPILQHVMFTYTRRRVQVDQFGEEMESVIFAEMENVFFEDLLGHQELAARFDTDRPPTEKETFERNSMLVDKYLVIYDRFLRSRRASGPVVGAGSPWENSPIPEAQANVQRPASMNINDASMAFRSQNSNLNDQQNFPSSDPWHQTPEVQHNPVVSNSSPNPLLRAVAGRPPSGTRYRSYSNAPSPTLLQGLSMNSPVIQSSVQQQLGLQWSTPTPVLRSNTYQVQVQGQPSAMPQMTPQQYQMQQQQQMAAQYYQQPATQQQQQMAAQYYQQPATQQQQQMAAQYYQQPATQQQQQMAAQYYQQPATQQLHQQITMQQQQQQQQQLAQHLQQNQQPMHPQAQSQLQPLSHPQAYQHAQQNQQMQNQQLEQQPQHMAMATQQGLSINRAAHLRSNSDAVVVQQRLHSRNNSVSSAIRPHVNSNSPSLSLPRPMLTFIPSPIIQNQAIQHNTSTHPLHKNLVPPLVSQRPGMSPDPDMTALHQAHISSPRLVPEEVSPNVPEDDPSRRFYQSVKNLAIGPIKIPFTSAVSYFEFSVPVNDYALISKDQVMGPERVPVRKFKRGSLQYRLRCIQSKRETSKCLMPEWIVSDTVWPETVFVEINTHQLEVRRKGYHGKDLPIDITQYVAPETSLGSMNRIKVSIPRLRKAMKDSTFFIAVEVVEVLQHDQIMEKVTQTQHISANKTLDAIKQFLTPPATDDDDDFAMVVSDFSIDLADPFTTRIFKIPVRGDSCLHRECFDLETFLLTRNSKPKQPNQPCMIDVWKCPLCSKDARPYTLKVDDFLVGVRGELAAQGKLDTKAILISSDGSWRPKPEPRLMKRKATDDSDNDDADSSDGEGTARRQQILVE